MCWETSCVSIFVCRETRFFSPVFQAKDIGKRRDTQTSRKIDLTYFSTPPPCIFNGCKNIMGAEGLIPAVQATPLPPAGSGHTVQHTDGPITLVLPVRNSKLRGSFTLECWSSPTPRE